MLVVNLNALQTVNVLNFLNQIFSQFLNAQDTQNVMRSRRAFNQQIAFLDNVSVLNNQMASLRNQIFNRLAFLRHNGNPLFGLIVLAEFDHTVNVGNNRLIFWTTSFKQLGNTRQTAGNILRLGAFSRNTGDNVTDFNLGTVVHRQNGINRQIVADFLAVVERNRLAFGIFQNNARFQAGAVRTRTPVDNHFGNDTGRLVNAFLNRNVVNQVNQLDFTFFSVITGMVNGSHSATF